MRGPVRAYRPRSPPPPPPQPPRPAQRPPSPQRPPPPPQPQPHPPRPTQRQIWIPVSDGTFALADGSTTVRRGYTGRISVTTDERGTRVVREEPLDPGFEERITALERSFTGVKEKKKAVPPPRPPPPKTPPAAANTEEGEWLTTRRPLTSTPRRPPRWVSPPPQRPRSPPPPYQGIVVTEVPHRPQTPRLRMEKS